MNLRPAYRRLRSGFPDTEPVSRTSRNREVPRVFGFAASDIAARRPNVRIPRTRAAPPPPGAWVLAQSPASPEVGAPVGPARPAAGVIHSGDRGRRIPDPRARRHPSLRAARAVPTAVDSVGGSYPRGRSV